MATDYATLMVETVDSTQDEVADRFDGSPLLVIAAHQTKGRGRLEREWMEPDRGMFASLGFEPGWEPEDRGLIPLAAALAMREALREIAGVDVGLRWPNDLVTPSGKVGGVLAEGSDDRVIVGCGVNLWWAEPIEGAAGVFDHDPGPDVAPDLARAWAGNLLLRLAAHAELWGHHEYEAACVTLGQPVQFEKGSGVAVGIHPDGSLLVETGEGTIAVHAGDVRLSATLPDGSSEETP